MSQNPPLQILDHASYFVADDDLIVTNACCCIISSCYCKYPECLGGCQGTCESC